jgi:hypothetical protein
LGESFGLGGEDIAEVEAEGFAFFFAANVGAEDVVLFGFRIEAVEVAIALPAHVAGVEKLGVEAAVAAVVHGNFSRGDELTAPPIIARVW